MATKMDLILAGPSGHVLAAGLRNDTSGSQPNAAALVGDALAIRSATTGNTILNVAAQHLSVQEVDLREDVLLTARQFVLVDGLPEKGSAPTVLPLLPLSLIGGKIRVTVPPNPQKDVPVWVYIEGAVQPVVQQLTVPKAATSAEEILVLPSGPYRALVLAEGVRAAIVEITAT